jgi:hypothetical protein
MICACAVPNELWGCVARQNQTNRRVRLFDNARDDEVALIPRGAARLSPGTALDASRNHKKEVGSATSALLGFGFDLHWLVCSAECPSRRITIDRREKKQGHVLCNGSRKTPSILDGGCDVPVHDQRPAVRRVIPDAQRLVC